MIIKEMIKLAKEAEACEDGIEWASQFNSIEELLADPNDNADYLYWYARYVIKGRWKEAEPVIATNPYYSYMYALHLLCGRFKKAEPVIATDPWWAYHYARDILKGRFKEAEAVIMTSPVWAYHYAILKGD